MKDCVIRKATHEDTGQVKALCLRDNPNDFLPGMWPVWMTGEHSVNLVAWIDDHIVGCVFGEILSEDDAWAQGLRVQQEFRKSGIGTMLMTALEEEMVRKGARTMYANVGAFNTACLATVFGRDWETAVHVNRCLIRPGGGSPSPSHPVSHDSIRSLVHRHPVPASCQKVAYFKRAYFSINDAYLEKAIKQKAIRVSPDTTAYAIVDGDTDPLQKIWIVAMAGSASGIQWLLESFIGDAGRSGAELVVDSPQHPEIQMVMDALNFEPVGDDGNYMVVKKTLKS